MTVYYNQLNLVSASFFGNIFLAAIICRCFIDFTGFYFCVLISFLVYCMCAFYVPELFCCFGVINK